MTPRRLKRRYSVVGMAVAAALMGGAPVGASGPDIVLRVDIRDTAAVQAHGAGVVVTMKVRCPAAQTAFVSLETTQAHPNGGITGGGGGGPVECAGTAQVVRLPIMPTGSSSEDLPQPFEPGPAFVSAELGLCTDVCTSAADADTIELRNRRIQQPDIDDPLVTMSLPAEASLQADGAGVVVTVPYTCAAGLFGSFQATLAQVTEPSAVANGFDTLPVRCTSRERTGILAYHAVMSRWVLGSAFIVLRGEGCADGDCADVVAFRTLKVS